MNDYLTSLMVLQKAEANNELDPYFMGIADQLGKNTAANAPFELISKSFSPANSLDIKLQYGDYWEQIHGQVKAVDMKSKLAIAGYSAEEIDSLPPEVVQHFATVDVFQEHFPTADKNDSLLTRLTNGKDALFDALNSEGGKKTLTAISLGISIGTGAIVTRMALRGGAFVASQIIGNESVQAFAAKMQSRVGNYLERMGVPTGSIAQKFQDFKDNARAVMASDTFQRYGRPSLALAGIAMGALMLGDFNHEKALDLATNGFNKTVDLASAGVELGAQGAHAANEGIKLAGEAVLEASSKAADLVADASVAAYDSVAQFGSDAAHALSGGVGTTMDFVADTAVDAFRAAETGVIVAGKALIHGVEAGAELVADGASAAYDAASYVAATAVQGSTEAASAASEYVASAYDATANGLASAVDSGRQFVGDGLHAVGDHIRGAGDLVADTDAPSAANDALVAKADAGSSTNLFDQKSQLTDADMPVPTEGVSGVSPEAVHQPYVIQKNDTLWGIAEDNFRANGVEPTQTQILHAAEGLYAANKDSIGADWNYIQTGKTLDIDPALFAVAPTHEVSHVAEVVAPATPVSDLESLSKLLGSSGSFPSSMVMSDEQAHQIIRDAGLGADIPVAAPIEKIIDAKSLAAESAALNAPAVPPTISTAALQDKVKSIMSDEPAGLSGSSWREAVDKLRAPDDSPSLK
ncbi:LysM domain-containing protein [Pseudomonas taiwanensis]|uniref:LysM peptidoglycan-binding domain-containing protein n=1 Tax=Pseudomonas taiwanensis TaxID=470150 RepID=UPI0028DFD5B6|nr:LysM domain-containing protein [Pseudomonas taiwanensis]MDT8925491.1 LysM domain-containing protein [Pseudomonas taiwanensis]